MVHKFAAEDEFEDEAGIVEVVILRVVSLLSAPGPHSSDSRSNHGHTKPKPE